jgi:two-component system cell cycle sensor histidine kinase/response regulator CckA
MGAETILVADDEPTVRTFVGGILRRAGFQTLEAADGAEALEQVKQKGPVDLLLTDVRMPRMDGVALARSITEMYPETPIIYISGYPFDVEEERSRHAQRPCAFLTKPFTRKDLLDAVQKCLPKPRGAAGNA